MLACIIYNYNNLSTVLCATDERKNQTPLKIGNKPGDKGITFLEEVEKDKLVPR